MWLNKWPGLGRGSNLHRPHFWTLLHGARAGPAGGAGRVDSTRLQCAREAIRRGEFVRARVLLSDWDETARHDARCLNVLGVLAVADSNWKSAARLWGAAVSTDPAYEAPRRNLRRYYELWQFGRSRVDIALGDEPEFRTS